MGAGQEVGRISIKVSPNTDDFRRELHDQLEAVENGEKAKVPVSLELEDGEREKIKAETEGIEAKVKVKADTRDLDLFQQRMLSELSSAHRQFEKNVPLTAQGESLRRAMETGVQSISRETRNKIPVDLELAAGQRAKILEEIAAVKRMAEYEPIKLKLDEEFGNRLRKNVFGVLEQNVKLKPALDAAAIEEMRLRLAHENFTAKVKLEVDSNNLERAARKAESDFDRALDKIFVPDAPRRSGGLGFRGMMPSIGIPELGSIGNFGSPANLLAILSLLPPALAILAPALAALPALIAAVAAPLGVFALGLDGIKKALDATGLMQLIDEGQDKKGADKKDKSQPGAILKDLQKQISDVFQQGLTPVFRDLVGIIPAVIPGLKGIAEGLVSMAKSAVGAFTTPAALNSINTLLSNIGALISMAGPGIASFSTGLLKMATQVSTHFPGLATFFDKLGDGLSGWVSKISADGTLDKAIAGLGPVLGSLFDFVGKMMDAGMKFAADPTMITAITTVLDNLTDLIMVSLPGLAGAFKDLAAQIQNAHNLIDGSHGKGHLTENGPQGDHARSNLAGTLSNPLVNPALAGLDGIGFGKGLAELGAKAEKNGVWNTIWDSLKNGFVNTLNLLPDLAVPILAALGIKFSKAFDGIWEGLRGALSGVATEIENIPTTLSKVWNGIGRAAQVGLAVLSAEFDHLVAIGKDSMNRLGNAVSTGVDEAVSFLKSLPGKAVAAIAGMGDQLYSAGAAAMTRLNEGLKSVPIVGPVISGLEGILKNIPHSPAQEGPMSGSGWAKLFDGGQAIGNQFQTGLESGFGGVVQSAQEMLGQLHSTLTGTSIGKGLKSSVTDEMHAIGQQMDQLRAQRDSLDPKDKAGRQGISDQLKQLETLRDQIKLEEDRLGITNQIGDKAKAPKDMGEAMQQQLGKSLQQMTGIGESFAMANINQFESDLGISGKGAIPTIGNDLLKWGTSLGNNLIGSAFGDKKDSVHIHVHNVDDALAAQQNIKNKQALSYAGTGR